MAQIFEISDETFHAIAAGQKNVYAIKKSRYKTLDGWEKAGSKISICVVRDDYTVREELRIPISKIESAHQRLSNGDGTEA